MPAICAAAVVLSAVCLLPAGLLAAVGDDAAPGATRVARWKDDRKGAFSLMFDDSCQSHVQNAIPELKSRSMIGVFYVNPGGGQFQQHKEAWEKQFPALGMEYGNHTFTHKGIKDAANADEELSKCQEEIDRCFPAFKQPRLTSFGRPGVPKENWTIPEPEFKQALARLNLIERPPFGNHGAMIGLKTADEMAALVDQAIADGSYQYVVFHGVGGDWISTPMPIFTAFLDKLAAKREQLWITGHIPVHKYQTERDSASVRIVMATATEIRLALTTQADPKLYDGPLTLITRVPAGWEQCQVVQGTAKAVVPATNGSAMFDAVPGRDQIVLERAVAK